MPQSLKWVAALTTAVLWAFTVALFISAWEASDDLASWAAVILTTGLAIVVSLTLVAILCFSWIDRRNEDRERRAASRADAIVERLHESELTANDVMVSSLAAMRRAQDGANGEHAADRAARFDALSAVIKEVGLHMEKTFWQVQADQIDATLSAASGGHRLHHDSAGQVYELHRPPTRFED